MPEFRLTLSTSFDDLAQSVVLPWLRLRTLLAWQSPRPTVLLVPTRAETFFWKEKLAAAGHPLLGISFWTPSDAREFLLPRTGLYLSEIASQFDAELLARQAAESLSKSIDPSDLIATRFYQAVQISPAPFLAQFEMLTAAGWNPCEQGSDLEREMARQFLAHSSQFSVQTQTQAHRELRHHFESSAGEPFVVDLLIAGFNATHWPIWDLLAAASLAAAQTTIALSAPTNFAQVPDQMWITAWENWAGKSYEIPNAESENDALPEEGPFAKLAESFETGTTTKPPPNNSLSLIVGPDLRTHARAIVTQTLLWLAKEDCTRIGLIFPSAGPLSLAVAEQLRDLDIPHNDGTGFLSPGKFAEPSWLAWLDLQENPCSANFLAWYLACQNEVSREPREVSKNASHALDSLELVLRRGERFEPGAMDPEREPTAEEVADSLNRALDRLLIDSLPLLQSYLSQSNKPRELRFVEILRDRVQLPAAASLRHFVQLTKQALDPSEGHQVLNPCLPTWAVQHLTSNASEEEPTLSLATYLKWLRAITDRRVRQRDSLGNEYYGKVHLLIAAQMSGQSWSHLLLADMNRGVWPKEPEPAPFLTSQTLENLNKTARSLNRNRTEDEVGHGYCLAPMDRPELSFRDLCQALENTSAALCLTASLKQGTRVSAPNELFSHVHQVLNGEALNDVRFQAMAGETGQLWGSRRAAIWECEPPPKQISSGLNLSPASLSQPMQNPQAQIIGQELFATSFAFRVRRDHTQPSGPFEFCFAYPPKKAIQMSCGQWDRALQHPASAWLDRIVGAESSPQISPGWDKTTGIWLHQWIMRSLHGFRDSADFLDQQELETPEITQNILDLLLTKLDAEEEADLEQIQGWCEATLTEVPHWWRQVRSQAISLTEQVLTTLARDLQEWEPYPECEVPGEIAASTFENVSPSLHLYGRMDCLLIRREARPAPGQNAEVESESAGQSFRLPDLARRKTWVIDFKTGSSSKLSLKYLGDPQRKGWQTVLYGWALSHLKPASISVSLMHPGERDAVLDLKDVLASKHLFQRLDMMHRHGLFGQPPAASQAFGFSPGLPIATLPISKAVLAAKWVKMLSKESAEDQ